MNGMLPFLLFIVSSTLVKVKSLCNQSLGDDPNELELSIRIDEYAEEIHWFLWQGKWDLGNTDNTLIVNSSAMNYENESNPYDFTRNCGKESKTVCIPNGCFTLYLNDSGYPPDGICCEYGFGYYYIKLNNKMITMSKLQYYVGNGTLLYFCTDLFGHSGVGSSNNISRKDLVYSSQHMSRIVVNRISERRNSTGNSTINTTLYDAMNFVPFGDAYQVSLPNRGNRDTERIEILIFQSDGFVRLENGLNSYSWDEWKLVHHLTDDDDWIIDKSTIREGMCCGLVLYLLFFTLFSSLFLDFVVFVFIVLVVVYA